LIDHRLTVDIQVFQLEGPAAHNGSQLNLAAANVKLLLVWWPNDVANGALRRIVGRERSTLYRLTNALRWGEALHLRRLSGQVDGPRFQPGRIHVELLRDDAHITNREHAIRHKRDLWLLFFRLRRLCWVLSGRQRHWDFRHPEMRLIPVKSTHR